MNHLKGLLKLKKDPRDFSHHKSFGSVVSIPEEFQIGQENINDQLTTDLCTAESSSEVSGDLFTQDFSPEYTFAKEKQILGNPVDYGADLRTACKAGKQYGYLPKTSSPFTLADKGRAFIADYKNWPSELDQIAAQFKIGGYFSVDGPYDTFDNVCAAMFSQQKTILAGSNWYSMWEAAPGGVIPETYDTNFGTLHAYKIFGRHLIGNVPYLMIQNSEGQNVGNNGVYFMSRAVANRELTEGLYYFTKNVPQDIEVVGNWFQLLIDSILRIFR